MIGTIILIFLCIILICGFIWMFWEIRKSIKESRDYNKRMDNLLKDIESKSEKIKKILPDEYDSIKESLIKIRKGK